MSDTPIFNPPKENVPVDPNRVPNGSEAFGIDNSQSFPKLRTATQRKNTHTVSVRDAAKMFEAAGVPRTERSIVKWCWLNRQGVARLDAYYDPNDRKYFITQESIDLAIKEELSKAQQKGSPSMPQPEETVPNSSEPRERRSDEKATGSENEELRKQVLDLTITNRAKDMFIEQLREERESFGVERQGYIDQLLSAKHQIGELETRLLQLEGPKVPRVEEPVSERESGGGQP